MVLEKCKLKIIIFTFLYFIIPIEGNDLIQCNLTKVWGPGLDPENILLPARYFIIETFSQNNNRLNQSPGRDVFNVGFFSSSQQLCRIRTDFLDRKDGSFIVRYKVYNTCLQLTISIKCRGEELPTFPHHFKNKVHPAECPCALNYDIEDWFQKFGCREQYKQIMDDLKLFESINFDKIFAAANKTFFGDVHRYSICNYIIKENQIYRKCYGQYTGFKMFVDSILLFITRRVRIPDIEILVNLGDWPLISNKIKFNDEKVLIPMFSWCGSEDTHDIILPTYDITESSLENLGRVSLDMLSVQGNTGPEWNKKIPKLFWRGRDSSRERLKLIKLGQQNEHLMNVSLTDFFFFKEKQSEYGPKAKRISFFEFFKFKYQINLDGTVAAYRFPYLLVGDSLVFKQDSPYYEFFYKELKEWEHYIPLKRDLSNLIENLEWAINHEEEARKISFNGRKYARENLLPNDIFCYHVKLFHEYAKKQITEEIKIRPEMEMVDGEIKMTCDCQESHNFEDQVRNEEL